MDTDEKHTVQFCGFLPFGALVLWWAISEPALVGPSGGQLRFRPTLAVAAELQVGAGTDELSEQETDEQSTITEPAGGTCGLCVPSPLTANGGCDLGV